MAAALNAHYDKVIQRHQDGQAFGRRFLEKIVQVPYRVPPVDAIGLIELGLISDEFSRRERVTRTSMDDASDSSADMTLKADPPEIRTRTEEEKTADKALLSEVMERLLNGPAKPLALNVRQIKTLVNTLKLHRDIDQRVGGTHPVLSKEEEVYPFAVFLLADLLDRRWLDLVLAKAQTGCSMTVENLATLKQEAEKAKKPLGVLAERPGPALELLEDIGTDTLRLREFYRIIGRPSPV